MHNKIGSDYSKLTTKYLLQWINRIVYFGLVLWINSTGPRRPSSAALTNQQCSYVMFSLLSVWMKTTDKQVRSSRQDKQSGACVKAMYGFACSLTAGL